MTRLTSIENIASIMQRFMKEGNLHCPWRLHRYMQKCGLKAHKFLGCYLIAVFRESGRVDDAREILSRLNNYPYCYSWNTLITCFIHQRNFQQAFTLYEKLKLFDSPLPSAHNFVALIKACTDLKNLEIAVLLHAEIARIGYLEQNLFTGSALMSMYAKCGSVMKAQEVFDIFCNQDIISWNELISGYVAFGDGEQALNCFEKMQMEGLLPNPITLVYVLKACGIVQAIGKGHEIHTRISHGYLDHNLFLGNALIDMYAKCGFLTKARQVFDILPDHDIISWNVLITAHTRHGFLVKAQDLFDKLSVRDVVSWNALIAGYAENGKPGEALICYTQMLEDGVSPNSSTFVSALKACGAIGAEDKGRKIHAEIIKRRLIGKDLMVGRSLVDMYARCGAFDKANEVYRMLPSQDSISITALVAGYVQHGLFAEAQQIFNYLQVRGVISWNALITGYVEYGYHEEAIECFGQMQRENVPPNNVTFVCALKACSSIGAIDRGQEIYAEIARKGWLEKDISIGNILINMYVKGGILVKAQEVLEGLQNPDLVSWNALMAGYAEFGYVAKAKEVFDMLKVRDVITWNTLLMSYVEHGEAETALQYFDKMHLEGVLPDAVTFISSLKACSYAGDLSKGHEIHKRLNKAGPLRKDLSISNSLIDMYAKCGSLMKAQEVFSNLPMRNVVSWNTIIGGYTEHEYSEEALEYFEKMQSEGISGDAVTYILCLKACCNIGAIDKALELHVEIVQKGILGKDGVRNTLIDVYSKHGLLAEAQGIFDQLSTPDVVSWNALISVYAQQREVTSIDGIFNKIVEQGIKPTLVTFINILKACSQKGLFDEALMYFESMNKVYGVLPNPEHRNCMIDLLGRAGHLDKMITMVNKMQGHGNLVIWHAILDACRQWGNLDFAKQAFHCTLQLDEQDASAYMLMSYVYESTPSNRDE